MKHIFQPRRLPGPMWIYWRVNQFFPLQAAFWVNSRAPGCAGTGPRHGAQALTSAERTPGDAVLDSWFVAMGVLFMGNLYQVVPPSYNLRKKTINYRYTSSTAQGGGGSFRNRKPIGEVGCCESRMAERIHWWTERWLQWSPHSQLLDAVWCSAVVVVVVAVVVVVVVALMLLKL